MQSVGSTKTLRPRVRAIFFNPTMEVFRSSPANLYRQVGFFGHSQQLDDYEQRKLRIFNQLNFLQLLTGLFIPLLGLAMPGKLPPGAWLTACWPAGVSLLVLALNYLYRYEVALYAYFLLYPLVICFVYLNSINPGIELYFILFVILAVFFLQDIGMMLFAIGFSMVSFFILSVVLDYYVYDVERENRFLYLLNKCVSLAFIFYGLFLVKKENSGYQTSLLQKQQDLAAQNAEIEQQKQTLAGLNAFKTKLFSIISHDLRSPMYALRTLFQNVHRYNPSADEVKAMVPAVLRDLDYTTSLMENLLQWAKSQMQAQTVQLQPLCLADLAQSVANLLRLQSEAKQIAVNLALQTKSTVPADKEMIHLVLRNLLSNAIKFTPEGGSIEVGVKDGDAGVEVYVKDAGVGINTEGVQKIRQAIFYSTTGTASESGTGLGLMLCQEFLRKNNSELQIASKPGKGSRFSFVLPKQRD